MEPTLAKPGAGIPWVERAFVRFWLMPREVRRRSFEDVQKTFVENGKRALSLARELSVEDLNRLVLVERVPGMEDSSRYWSVAMTLDHLMIVGEKMSEAICLCAEGKPIPFEADVAKVKPPVPQQVSAEVLGRFELFLARVDEKLRNRWKNRDSQTRFPHPWFGAMTPKQWHWVMAGHQRLHRVQVQKIIQGLRGETSHAK
jgi:hypothetical protein